MKTAISLSITPVVFISFFLVSLERREGVTQSNGPETAVSWYQASGSVCFERNGKTHILSFQSFHYLLSSFPMLHVQSLSCVGGVGVGAQ